MTSIDPPDALVTYRRVDGELIFGEYSFATHPDSLEDEAMGSDEPIEYCEEIWTLLERKVIVKCPPAYCCSVDPDCDNDADEWRKINGEWVQCCPEHLPSEEGDEQDDDDQDQQTDDDVGGSDSHGDTIPVAGLCSVHGGLMWSQGDRACILPTDVIRGGCAWKPIP